MYVRSLVAAQCSKDSSGNWLLQKFSAILYHVICGPRNEGGGGVCTWKNLTHPQLKRKVAHKVSIGLVSNCSVWC